MAKPLAAAVLGAVEGVTEFLPISSTGHLIVAADLLRFESDVAFEIIQLGAVLVVTWFYHRQLLEQARRIAAGHQLSRGSYARMSSVSKCLFA